MRNKDAQRRHTKFSAPEAPRDLRERCLATIPEAARTNAPAPRFAPAPLRKKWIVPRLVLAGGMVCGGLLCSTVWTTHTSKNTAPQSSGNNAFAQTVDAMKNVDYVQINARRLNPQAKDDTSASNWDLATAWYDSKKGQLVTAGQEAQHPQKGQQNPVKPVAYGARKLQLSDGTAYIRVGSTLKVTKSPQKWQAAKKVLPLSLLGNAALVANTKPNASSPPLVPPAEVPKLKSTQPVQWNGQKAKLIQFETPATNKSEGTRTKLYVDADTHRVLEMQEFAVKNGAPERLVVQAQAQYKRPAPQVFDAEPIRAGATKVVDVPDNNDVTPDEASKMSKDVLIKRGWVSIGKINGREGLIDGNVLTLTREGDNRFIVVGKPKAAETIEGGNSSSRVYINRTYIVRGNGVASAVSDNPETTSGFEIPPLANVVQGQPNIPDIPALNAEALKTRWISIGKINGKQGFIDSRMFVFVRNTDGQILLAPKPSTIGTPEGALKEGQNYTDYLFNPTDGPSVYVKEFTDGDKRVRVEVRRFQSQGPSTSQSVFRLQRTVEVGQ